MHCNERASSSYARCSRYSYQIYCRVLRASVCTRKVKYTCTHIFTSYTRVYVGKCAQIVLTIRAREIGKYTRRGSRGANDDDSRSPNQVLIAHLKCYLTLKAISVSRAAAQPTNPPPPRKRPDAHTTLPLRVVYYYARLLSAWECARFALCVCVRLHLHSM